ncbi:MAG: hypothetical protein Q7U54_22045 [Bacteroidales bacterium]|nr:hypothetical protein [Bacteroidales bacterium]
MKTKLITLTVLLFTCYVGFSQNTSGTYTTDFNEMTITQNGNKVTGTYKHQNGKVEGTLSGHTLTGLWFQDNGKGKMVFEFNSDYTAFTGKWGYNEATPSGKWNGTRIAGQTPAKPPQTAQQQSPTSTQKTTTDATTAKSSKSNDNLNTANPVSGALPQKNKPQAKGTTNEPGGTKANANRKPLNEHEKSLVKEAKSDLEKAITLEDIADSERTKMVQKSAKTLKEYGQPAAFPVGDIPLKTNREKDYKRIQAEVVSANNLRKLLSEALLAEQMSLINSMQIDIVEEQIKILIPGKAPFDLSKDLVGTVFNFNITEGFGGGQRQDAKDLVQKFRDLALTNEFVADIEKLYLRQQDLMNKAYLNIEKAEKLQAQLRKSYQDAENSAFTFKEFTPSGVSPATNTGSTASTTAKGEGKGLWVLVETIYYDGKKDLDNTNKNGVYQVSGSCSPGSYDYTWKYLGKADSYYNPPLLSDENSAIKCTASNPPKVMDAGESISLTLSLSFTAHKLSYFSSDASVSADFDKWDVAPGFSSGSNIRFANSAGKSTFKISTHKSVKVYSIHEVVTATAPSGVKDMRIALRTLFNPGARMGTCYIYEWKYAY